MDDRSDLFAPIERRIVLFGVVVVLGLAALQLATGWSGLSLSLGDSDDALRLMRVRDLLAGREGWYDLIVDRIGPPPGGEIHWSRLLDGAMAAALGLLRLVLPAPQAETLFRALWPLVGLPVAVAGAMGFASALSGRKAALLCGLMLLMTPLALPQFTPGRIDHHNLQIALAVAAAAGALRPDRRGGLVAGACTALGLAIGVEALLFHALAGAAIALRWAQRDTDGDRRALGAYGAALLIGLPLLFLAQTPPPAWLRPVCDALGPNLVAAAGFAAVGCLVLSRLRLVATPRFLALGTVGAAAAIAYVLSQPACLAGPLGQADPALWPIWLDNVQEVQSLARMAAGDPALALVLATPGLVALAATVALLAKRADVRRRAAWWIGLAFLILAMACLVAASRMISYALWIAMPATAAVLARMGDRWRPVALVAAALALSPTMTAGATSMVAEAAGSPPSASPTDACTLTASYARLAALPPGLVAAEPYLGSHIVVLTPHRVLSAPYHRMAKGILIADALLRANPAEAQGEALAAHVDYVVVCRGLDRGRLRRADGSLRRALFDDRPPPWLQPLSSPQDPLAIYRVAPRLR